MQASVVYLNINKHLFSNLKNTDILLRKRNILIMYCLNDSMLIYRLLRIALLFISGSLFRGIWRKTQNSCIKTEVVRMKKQLLSILLALCMVICMIPITANAMEINIDLTVVGGANLTLEVESGDSADNIKEKIQNKTGIPADMQKLIYDGKEFVDGRTLGEYNIQSKAP